MFKYCARCGLIRNEKAESAVCPVCDISLKPVPGEFLTKTGLMFLSQSVKTEFENKIPNTPKSESSLNMMKSQADRKTALSHRKTKYTKRK